MYSIKDPVTDLRVLTETSCSVELDVEKNHFMRNFPHFNAQGAKSYEISVCRGKSYEFGSI